MARFDITTYNTSVSLKNAMSLKGFDTSLHVFDTFYETSSLIHLILGISDAGYFRTLGSTGEPDYFEQGDARPVRMWTEFELHYWINNNVPISGSRVTKTGQTYTYVLVRNGVEYSGSDQSISEAMAIALTALINAL
jgi:hypothetical protein